MTRVVVVKYAQKELVIYVEDHKTFLENVGLVYFVTQWRRWKEHADFVYVSI